jgi:hypothetical protein
VGSANATSVIAPPTMSATPTIERSVSGAMWNPSHGRGRGAGRGGADFRDALLFDRAVVRVAEVRRLGVVAKA